MDRAARAIDRECLVMRAEPIAVRIGVREDAGLSIRSGDQEMPDTMLDGEKATSSISVK